MALEDIGKKEKMDYPGVGEVSTKNLSWNKKIVAGLIEYVPIEETNFPVKGENLAFIDCIWVIPPFWRKGVAKSLTESFLEKTNTNILNEMSLRVENPAEGGGVPPLAGRRSNLYFSGAAVIAYEKESWWGFFDYMPKWFFQKFGFKQVERDGNSILMFKNYKEAQPPKLVLARSKSTSKPTKIKTELFWSNQCPYSWWVKKLTEKEFGKSSTIELSFVNTDDRKTVEKSGITFGLTVDGKIIYNRIPSWDEVKKTLKSVISA